MIISYSVHHTIINESARQMYRQAHYYCTYTKRNAKYIIYKKLHSHIKYLQQNIDNTLFTYIIV
jgi:hypothetical protein